MTLNYPPPSEHRVTVNGVELCYFQWGRAQDPVLLLVHATGFHGRCWDQVVAHLPAGLRIIAPEMRGHGRSARCEPYDWATMGADLVAFADALSLTALIAAGHSMGGHCLLQLAIARPGLIRQMLLLDPVVFEPDAYVSDRYHLCDRPEDHPVARRRSHWPDWHSMRDSLVGKGSFGIWNPAVLNDYCRYGCLPVADGVELACPPLVEAAVYLSNTQTDVHADLIRVQAPTLVMRAAPRDPDAQQEMDFSKSPTWPGLATALPNGRDLEVPELTHFIPMQAPERVACQMTAMLNATD